MLPKSLTLLRGQSFDQVEDESLAIVCVADEAELGKPSPFFLALILPPGEKPRLLASPSLGSLQVEVFSQGHQVALPSLGLLVCFGVLPWWQFPDFSIPEGQRVVYVPLRAWRENQWHDGPLAHFIPEGYLSSYVPAGASAKLCLPMEYVLPTEEVIPYIRSSFTNPKMKAMSMRTSAAFGLRAQLTSLLQFPHCRIEVKHYDQTAIVLMCLLRIAFPDESMELIKLPEDKLLHSPWKRLCQNLDIICGKAPRPTGATSLVELDRYRNLLPEHMLPTLLSSLTEHSDLIPHRLVSP
ncbi:MAG: hypothetical protein ACOH5I_17065 [Oligoflexus sp.]